MTTLRITASIVFGVRLLSQEPIPKAPPMVLYSSECGNPAMESSIWASLEGTVERVLSGNSILLRLPDGKGEIKIRLVAVKTPFRLGKAWSTAKRELENRILGKEVFVLLPLESSFAEFHGDYRGVVHQGGRDVNFELIKLGLCKYQVAPPYAMSNFTECTYRQAEKAARSAKVGVWSD